MHDSRLPVPVTVHGPLKLLCLRVHDLSQTGRCHEALAAADAYTAIAEAVGDDKSVTYLYQGRMYAYDALGRVDEAIGAGEELLRRHRAAGNRLHEAKTLSDLASLYLLAGRVVDAMINLARADLLLQSVPLRDANYASAISSYGTAVHAAGLYEAAQAAYERLAGSRTADDFASGDELGYMAMLLTWGLRLDQIGYHWEAVRRLHRSATIARRWIASFAERGAFEQVLDLVATRALALAKLGDTAEARRLAEAVVVPLRRQEDHYASRIAHLALGIVHRAEGDHAAARREFLAAEQLQDGIRPEERLIIRYELASLAAERIGTSEARDLLDTVREQARQLWRVRLERVGLLRQAQHREAERAHAEQALHRDVLTGLSNRRRFDMLMRQIDDDALPRPTTLVLLDVDRFKHVNDVYSHAVGDQVLRAVAAAVLDHCRDGDQPIRYAGDEFCIFLRTDLDRASAVAERIREAVRATDFSRLGADLSVSVSIGVAPLRPGMTGVDLFNAADQNLYHAKRAGRDRVAA